MSAAPLSEIGGGAGWLPEASSFAPRVDRVFDGLLAASAGMALFLTVLTLVILVRYRRGSAASRKAVRIATWKIETAWIVATTAVFLFFFVQGTSVYLEMRRIPAGIEAINVVGRQWMWDVRYPGGRREFNRLHVRLNTPVRLLLSSEDVIHSFFVPAFRLKQDLVPGKVVEAWFDPTRAGTYMLYCAQYCGTAHAEMTGTVVVLAPDQFAAWEGGRDGGAESGSPGLAGAARGSAIFQKYGCAQCHGDAAGSRAPRLAGVYRGPVRLADGRFVLADDQFLHDAILRAPKCAVAGYAMTMPTYDGVIPEGDVLDLISYIKALTPAPASQVP